MTSRVHNENKSLRALVLMSYHHETQLSHGWQYKVLSHPCRFSTFQNNRAWSGRLYYSIPNAEAVNPQTLPHGESRPCLYCHPLGTLGHPREDKIFSLTGKTLLEEALSGTCSQLAPSPTVVAGKITSSYFQGQ